MRQKLGYFFGYYLTVWIQNGIILAEITGGIPWLTMLGADRRAAYHPAFVKGDGQMDRLDALMAEIVTFTEERDWDQFHSPVNLAKSISIEAGELLECYQWDDKANPSEVEEELADILNYSLLLASKLSLDPIEIVRKKLEVSARKYPVEKSKGRSTKYDKL